MEKKARIDAEIGRLEKELAFQREKRLEIEREEADRMAWEKETQADREKVLGVLKDRGEDFILKVMEGYYKDKHPGMEVQYFPCSYVRADDLQDQQELADFDFIKYIYNICSRY